MAGGICDETTAHALRSNDFYKITYGLYGIGYHLYTSDDTSLGDSGYGSPYCLNFHSNKYCGYNNDIIDNGGYYWFGSAYNTASVFYWRPDIHNVYNRNGSVDCGVRSVLKLDSTITLTGGEGTLEVPYAISTRVVS